MDYCKECGAEVIEECELCVLCALQAQLGVVV